MRSQRPCTRTWERRNTSTCRWEGSGRYGRATDSTGPRTTTRRGTSRGGSQAVGLAGHDVEVRRAHRQRYVREGALWGRVALHVRAKVFADLPVDGAGCARAVAAARKSAVPPELARY